MDNADTTGWRRHVIDFGGASGASFLATAADGLVFWLLVGTDFFDFGGSEFWIGVAAAAAAVLGGVIHYSLSRFWVFRRFAAPLVGSAILYFAMSWSAALGHGWLTGTLSGFVASGWAWFISKGVLWMVWTYPVSRWVVFGGLMNNKSK